MNSSYKCRKMFGRKCTFNQKLYTGCIVIVRPIISNRSVVESSKRLTKALENKTADINELNRAITKTLIKINIVQNIKENKISSHTRTLIEQRRALNHKNSEQEIRATNKEISKKYRAGHKTIP